MSVDSLQKDVCFRYGAAYFPCPGNLKLGISRSVKNGMRPINGLRVNPVGDTCGWYIWAGEEWSDAPDFFVPLHVEHLKQWAPSVIAFLGLPPGWRFLFDENVEDVWEDSDLVL